MPGQYDLKAQVASFKVERRPDIVPGIARTCKNAKVITQVKHFRTGYELPKSGEYMPGRIERVKKMIKNEISAILSGDINDPRIKHVMITDVEMSRDLRNATVLYTVEDEETPKEDVSRGLKRAGSFIRAELAERISMKYMPRIIFREDRAQEREESVNRLFDLIAGEREDKEDRNGKDA